MGRTINRAGTTNPEAVREVLAWMLGGRSDKEQLEMLKRYRSTVVHMADKGGVVAVTNGENVITAYRYESYKR